MNEYVKCLNVKDFGLFKNLSIVFSPDVNIIIGVNGAGKTSILKLICLCLNGSGFHYTSFQPGSSLFIDIQRKSGDTITLGGVIRQTYGANFRSGGISEWNSFSPSQKSKGYLLPGNQSVNYNLLAIGAYRQVNYVPISGMNREKVIEEARNNYRSINIESLENSYIPDIKQWMINRYFIVDKPWATTQRHNWERILSELPKISPINSQIVFERIESDLEPFFSVNGKECHLEELSSGFKSILSIMFTIVEWCESVNEGAEARIERSTGTVIIDEIDAHLHPKWQGTIVSSIKSVFPNLQFILTSHYPLVIGSAESNQVIRIPEHEGVLKLEPESKNYKGWQLQYILEDLMQTYDLSDISDEILIPIDKAYTEKDLKSYELELEKLKTILSPKDPLIQFYQIRRTNLILDDSAS